ncbi:RidA family protein [Rhizobium pusense]|uniref:RidA family protein n=1 Tax=Agrobacterium pusense TaxID=648995 RepID=A0A6H0ZJ89_9HYPH|nr:RidA family protein [Agrobacterium pusense]MDH2092339.1 RidA family protein [Agrobacterium pusense]QIX19840.1 RidA family protein [Agrobacterium pusense]WCK27622.1 RidA family protein [Agrobacterium pusense]
MTIQRYEPNGKRLSHVLVNNGTVYVTGQVPTDRSQGIEGQTQQLLDRIDHLLSVAGTEKSKILFAQIWLKDIKRDFAKMNAVWEEWVPEDALPARATVEANLAADEILIEIALQATL